MAWVKRVIRTLPDVGRMQDIPGAHEVPDPSETYKIVFDLSSTSDKIDEANPGLTAVARW
jgi:hypothetical protein